MAKKSKTGLRKTLSKEVVMYIIDMSVGPHLIPLAMKEPKRAQAVSTILINMVNETYEGRFEEWDTKGGDEAFIHTVTTQCVELFNTFILKRLADVLKKGMDTSPSIVLPNQINNKH